MSSLQSFTLFPALPTEIRLQIWDIIIYTPRTLEVYIESRSPNSLISLHCRNPVPALLHVCQESRQEGLKSYSVFERFQGDPLIDSLVYGRPKPRRPAWVRKHVPSRIYVSYWRDTLYFGRRNSYPQIRRFLTRELLLKQNVKLRMVALNIDHPQHPETRWAPFPKLKSQIPAREAVVLVLSGEDELEEQEDGTWRELKFVAPQCVRHRSEFGKLNDDPLCSWECLPFDAGFPDRLSSFGALGAWLRNLWEEEKKLFTPLWHDSESNPLDWGKVWGGWRIPSVEK